MTYSLSKKNDSLIFLTISQIICQNNFFRPILNIENFTYIRIDSKVHKIKIVIYMIFKKIKFERNEMINIKIFTLVILSNLIMITACSHIKPDNRDTLRIHGSNTKFGLSLVESYADVNKDGDLEAIGISFDKNFIEQLPDALTDGHRCHDLDGDDVIDSRTECLHWHEKVLPLPTNISRRDDVPFKWVLLNWNPHGHMPEGVWNTPHFDVHFYIEPIENVFALMPGPCGPELMRCDQYELAIKPVPSNYIHEDFIDVGAAAPAMGNHLIDPTAPEFHGEPFTRSWLYGAYDGRIIFWEEMVALDYLLSQPQECFPIKTPSAVEVSGFYPTSVCTRYNPETADMSISIEQFIYRQSGSTIAIN
jgi:hypothetical protein